MSYWATTSKGPALPKTGSKWSAARLCEEVSHDAAPRARYGQGTDEEYALVEELVRARTAAKLTQAEVARRLGTTQSAIARLEGGRVSPSFATLRRYAEATGTRLTVGLLPADG